MDLSAEIYKELKMCSGALNIPFLIDNMHLFGRWALLISIAIGHEEMILYFVKHGIIDT